jgi:hypothetical protein
VTSGHFSVQLGRTTSHLAIRLGTCISLRSPCMGRSDLCSALVATAYSNDCWPLAAR